MKSFDDYLSLIPVDFLNKSGCALLSGRASISAERPLMILSLNPGGNPSDPRHETVAEHAKRIMRMESDSYSTYRDASWEGLPAGTAKIQRHVRHVIEGVGLDLGAVPTAHLIFLRTTTQQELQGESRRLADRCWPFHEALIRNVKPKVIMCFGNLVAGYVRGKVCANTLVHRWKEKNNRGWTHNLYQGPDGRRVLEMKHPGRAYWDRPATDPTELVQLALFS